MNRKVLCTSILVVAFALVHNAFALAGVEKLERLKAKLPGPVFLYKGDAAPLPIAYPDPDDVRPLPRPPAPRRGAPPLSSGTGTGLPLAQEFSSQRFKLLSRALDEGGMAADAAANGNYCYVATTGGLSVYDVTNALEPDPVYEIENQSYSLEIESSLLAAVQGPGGDFVLFDIFDPARPVEISRIRPPEGFFFWDLTVDGSLAVATGLGELEGFDPMCAVLQVIDISDPYAPEVKSTMLGLDDMFRDVVIENTDLYLTVQWEGLAIFDVSDPAVIIQQGFTNIYGTIDGMVLDGGYLYCAGAGIQIVDVTDPSDPELIGEHGPGYTCDIRLSGHHAYVTDDDDHSLRVFDVLDPANPIEVGELEAFGIVYYMDLEGDRIYLADQVYGLLIVDITAPETPVDISLIHTGVQPHTADVEGGLAAATANSSWLYTLDVTDPFAPAVLGSTVPAPATTPGKTLSNNGIDLAGSEVVTSEWFWGMHVYDVAAPALPSPVGDLKIGKEWNPVARTGDLVYTGSYQLVVVDITDPADPKEVGAGPSVPSGITDIVISGDKAFVAGRDEIVIVDLIDPLTPGEVTRLSMNDWVKAVAVKDDLLGVVWETYHTLLTSSSFFELYDVSNPSEPVHLGSLELPYPSSWVQPGGSALVAQKDRFFVLGYKGLFAVDVEDPWNPSIAGVYPESPCHLIIYAPIEGVCAADGLLYMTGFEGLEILRFLDVGVFLTPEAEPTVVAQGKSFTYTLELENFTDHPQTVCPWVDEVFPDSSSGPKAGPLWITLEPGDEATYTRQLNVPLDAPVGMYQLYVRLRAQSGEELDNDRITFEVVP